jgi:protein involved in polysaccharide export with SLBB domain
VLLSIAVAAFLINPAVALHAQCSDQEDGDSLGCAAPLPSASSDTGDSAPVLNVTEAQKQNSPRADTSNEASATGSLSAGAAHTEGGIGNSGGLHGGLTSQPEKLTEFQQFVAASTGQTLSVYGANLFTAPASFGPLDHGPAPGQLTIGVNDELRIRVWGQVNFSANLRVSREGEIYIPKVGNVHVAGLPFSAIPGQLRSAIARVYRNFEMTVDMGEIHSIQIYVTGLARRPGEYTVSALSTLVDTLFSSGGPSTAGSMRHVLLRREGRVIADFDLYALLVKGDKTGDIQLQPGDVLYIPATGPQVALLGSVRQAGIYELRGEESIERLLDAAGGKTTVASGAHLSVERIEGHSRRRAFELAADAGGLATPLVDGDIVRIDPIVSSFKETVTLRGSVANPGRFRWHAGMRLSELMPDRDSLVTRNYWWLRTQLGIPAPELAGSAGNAASQSVVEKPETVSSPGAQTDWNYAVIERLDSSTMKTSLIPFNLGKLVLDHDSSQDVELEPGDVVTIFSQQDIHPSVDEQTKYVRLEGEFVHGGIYSVSPGETLRSLVARVGGLTPKAYLYGSEFTRKSTQLIEQQRLNEYTDRLEHELQRNSIEMAGAASATGELREVASVNSALVARLRQMRASGRVVLDLGPHSSGESALPDLPLEDGDRLVVPSMPATVQVVGAVFNQNAFLYRGSARASDYLHLAGGPSREADRARTFILRADGSVTPRQAGQSIFASSGFDRQRLYPGDTIVVPEKTVRPSAVSEIMAWGQFASGVSLSALVANSLK